MKYALILLLVTFNALAATKTIKLSPKDVLQVKCPATTEMLVTTFTMDIKCVCENGSEESVFPDGSLKCESVCEIKRETGSFMNTACNEYNEDCEELGIVHYDGIKVNKNRNIQLYSQKIHTKLKSEFDYLFNEAVEISKKSCDRVKYNGSYL